jgi:gamma-glutamyltranspeptidase / glutathione hydrolase
MPSAVLNTILELVDHGASPVEAVDAPRFHAESPWLEMESRLYCELGPALAQRGWRLRPSARGYEPLAFAQVFVALRERDGGFRGGSDPRGGGGIALA